MEQVFLDYVEAFRKMNRACVRGYKAPHKLILLLSILELVRQGRIVRNRIELSEELMDQFAFAWKQYVDDGDQRQPMMVADGLEIEIVNKYPFKCSIANPFFHMEHEPFWTLIKSAQYEKRNDYRLNMLRKCFEGAELESSLFELMQDERYQERIRNVLLSTL